MRTRLRSIGCSAWSLCLAATAVISAQPPPPQTQPTVPLLVVSSALGSPTNMDALVSPNTFVVIELQTRDLPIRIEAPLSGGSVNLTIQCCTDALTGQPAGQPDLRVSIDPYSLPIGPSHSGTATLHVKAFNVRTAPLLATVHVDNNARKFHATGTVLLNILKVPGDDKPTCSRLAPKGGTAVEVLPMMSAIASVFMGKEASPSQTTFEIGAATADALHGWKMTIDSGGALSPTASTVIFKNDSTDDKQIVPFDTSSCMPSSATSFIAKSGKSISVPISSPSTTTLLLQRFSCRFALGPCWSWTFDDVAVFSPAPFWTLFGGRRVTIEWIKGGADL